jgi:polyisoprenoid-binding protein YceI
VANAPTASFDSPSIKVTGDKTAMITYDLTIHGITKPVDLDTPFIGEGKDQWVGYSKGFTRTTAIKLWDYGMGGVIVDQKLF